MSFLSPVSKMGAGAAPVLAMLTPHPQHLIPKQLCSPKFSDSRNCALRQGGSFAIEAGGRVGGSEWEKAQNQDQNGRRSSRYSQDDFDCDYDYHNDDEEIEFKRSSGKQRTWWAYDASRWDADSEEKDDDDDCDEDWFGVLEGSVGGFSSIFKILRAFGWVVPAIIVSMLLGTGANAFVIALALPLAQSALSSVLDMIWGWSPDRREPKSRSQKRKRASSAAGSGCQMREEREWSGLYGKSSDEYKSWVAKDNVSAGKAEGRARSFGGWDELDDQKRKDEGRKTSTANKNGGHAQGKLSRRAKNRQTPLVMRLLIAFFPFLGFLTKLL